MTTPDDYPRARVAYYESIQAIPEFARLRGRRRRFLLITSAAFLASYAAYILLAACAPALMRAPVAGSVNVGLVLGFLQVLITFVITTVYLRYTTRRLDPDALLVRRMVEDGRHSRVAPPAAGTAARSRGELHRAGVRGGR